MASVLNTIAQWIENGLVYVVVVLAAIPLYGAVLRRAVGGRRSRDV